MPKTAAMVDGLVVVDKPAGCTSHDVVAALRKAYGQRRPHGGRGVRARAIPDGRGGGRVRLGHIRALARGSPRHGAWWLRAPRGAAADQRWFVRSRRGAPVARDGVGPRRSPALTRR